MTAGQKSGRRTKPAKEILVLPLDRNFRDVLQGLASPARSPRPPRSDLSRNDPATHGNADRTIRHKAGHSGRNNAGFNKCRKLGIAVPQREPVAASSICKARQRVHEDNFLDLHREILRRGAEGRRWRGRRLIAVDGSKMNLPRGL